MSCGLCNELFWLLKGPVNNMCVLQSVWLHSQALRLRSLLLMDSKWYYAMIFYCPGVFVGMITMGQMLTRWYGENLAEKQLDCSCLVDA